MKTRTLGTSGLRITEIAYGNWLTHGSQVEAEAAHACVRQALEEGITTFDTADVYANTAAETVLGEALEGERREGLEIFTKVFWPTGPGGHNDSGLSRKHIFAAIDASLRRLGMDHVDLYQIHRFDPETPIARPRPQNSARYRPPRCQSWNEASAFLENSSPWCVTVSTAIAQPRVSGPPSLVANRSSQSAGVERAIRPSTQRVARAST